MVMNRTVGVTIFINRRVGVTMFIIRSARYLLCTSSRILFTSPSVSADDDDDDDDDDDVDRGSD